MLFNSFDFGLFLVVVYSLYWLIGTSRRNTQNLLLLAASYLFYGFWDYRFLLLLLGSSLIDFVGALAIHRSTSQFWRKIYLWHNIFWNIGILVLFKYYDFFLRGFYTFWGMDYAPGSFNLLNVIIPVGLSFYTFQTLSYTIDVYRGKMVPEQNLLNFMCFVSFFPQLVAGPIERAGKLLPQFRKTRNFDLESQKDGLRRILWGLFKKVVIADNLGINVSEVFASPESYGTANLLLGATLFAGQIYCDFTGYTDIALGSARLFGFKLSENFRLPYLAHSMTNFWKRWHITLTQWFVDYVYIPLLRGFRNRNTFARAFAILLTMLLIGLWHGANWTFVFLGLFDGLILIIERFWWKRKSNTFGRFLDNIPYAASFLYFFLVVTVHNVLFRAEDMEQAKLYFTSMTQFGTAGDASLKLDLWILCFLCLMVAAELLTRKRTFPLARLDKVMIGPLRWTSYYVLIFLILRFSVGKDPFIYFQF